jgi:hypothetical protein
VAGNNIGEKHLVVGPPDMNTHKDDIARSEDRDVN